MLNYIKTAEEHIINEPTVQEAENTLKDLFRQLEEVDDLEVELNTSSESVAYAAFTGSSAAKGNLERLERDIATIQTKQRMLKVAITQAEGLLTKARKREADNVTRKQAEEARDIAGELKNLGASMDDNLLALITNYEKIKAASVHLDMLGFPLNKNLNIAILCHLATSLQLAGFDIQGFYGLLSSDHIFENILEDQEKLSRVKTNAVLKIELEAA
jgi:hypothetical protein